jgi:hypothetical protein
LLYRSIQLDCPYLPTNLTTNIDFSYTH